MKLGPTNKFPQGKVSNTDCGELRLAIGADLKQQIVVVDFGAPTSWIGMPRKQAIAFAEKIKNSAEKLLEEQ